MSETPTVTVTVSAFTGSGKSAICGEIEIAMRAIGVPVEWVGGDDEKRLTQADWQSDLELYQPRVRIVEENVPRPIRQRSGESGTVAPEPVIEAVRKAMTANGLSVSDEAAFSIALAAVISAHSLLVIA